MPVEWILNPYACCGALAMGLLLLLILNRSASRKLKDLHEALEDFRQAMDSKMAGWDSELRVVQRGFEEASERNSPPGHALNLTRRAQALRMHRRGEPIPTIAAALQCPSNEIALLVKVDTLLDP